MSLVKLGPLSRILAAYTVNQLGWWFALVALSLGVYSHTQSSFAVAAVFVAGLVPALLAPAVVARVEASPRSGGLSVLYAIEAACAVGLAALLWQFSLPAILALVALDGSVAFAARGLVRSEAARAAEASRTSDESAPNGSNGHHDEAHRANAALNISLALTGVGGPALAGVLVKATGAPVALLIDAACFGVSGMLLLDLRPHIEEAQSSVRARLAAARAYLRARSSLRSLMLTQGAALVFFFCVIPVEVGYVTSTLRSGDLGYGLLLATWGTGMVCGSILFARAGRFLWTMLIGGTLAVGLAYVGFAVAPSLAVACLAAVPGGLGNGVQWAAFIGGVQDLTPRNLLGRMMGIVEGGASVAQALGYALGGALALISARTAMLSAGLGACTLALIFVPIVGLLRRTIVANEPARTARKGPAKDEPGMGSVAP